MSIFYNRVPRPEFLWDADNPNTYVDASNVNDILSRRTMTMAGVTANTTDNTYTFSNPTTGTSTASDYIVLDPGADDDQYAFKYSGCSASVTFYNTAALDGTALTYFRQTPFGYGTDSRLGHWVWERFYTSSNFGFRWKDDGHGTYGGTIGLGEVPLNETYQLGFTATSTELKMFKNGVLYSTTDVSARSLATPATDSRLCIGAAASTSQIYGFIGLYTTQLFGMKLFLMLTCWTMLKEH